MVLSLEGWLNGITALSVVIIDVIFGIYILYKSRKLNATLLTYAGGTVFFTGMLWLGPTSDFLTILLTQSNMSPSWLYGMLSYMWIAPAVFFAMYIGAELLFPEKKKVVLVIYLILGILFEILLFTNLEGSFVYTIPVVSGENIIDTSFDYGYPTFILIVVFILSVFFLNGIGFLRKALQSTGNIKRKFLSLSIGFLLFSIAAVFDSVVPPGLALPFVRIAVLGSAILIFWGLAS